MYKFECVIRLLSVDTWPRVGMETACLTCTVHEKLCTLFTPHYQQIIIVAMEIMDKSYDDD